MFAARKFRCRKSPKSTSGSRTRRSTITKTATSTSPAAIGPITPASPHPATAPWLSPKMSRPSATAKTSAPSTSTWREAAGSRRRSGVELSVSTIVVTASPTLMHEDEPPVDRGQQPAEDRAERGEGGRAAGEHPERGAPLRERGKMALTRSPPTSASSARPHSPGPRGPRSSTASTAPPRRTSWPRRRPPRRRGTRAAARSRSPSRPPRTMNAASGRMFAVRIHCDSSIEPPRSLTARGVARGTAVWSTRIMLAAIVIAASVTHIARVTGSGEAPLTGATVPRRREEAAAAASRYTRQH